MGQLSEALKGIALPDEAKALVSEADILLAKRREQAQYIDHLESEIKRLRAEKGISETRDNLKFDEITGTHIDPSSNLRYCTRCLSDEKRSPLQNGSHGWKCMVCGKFYSDPRRPHPTVVSDYDPFR